ncbi:MAG TPA: hypothetical protein QF604_10820 [Candidatus Latescibacteria bacterium]|nr:hypothetical protein [Candidatus Latescibacterota bacterium]
MIWVILVVLVCEVVIFTQLMLNFQKRGDRLKIARAPILKRIEQHRQALVELSEKVQTKTAESLEKVDEKIADATHSAGFAANLVDELDNEAHERAEELGLNSLEEEEEEEEEEAPANGEEQFNPTNVEKDKAFDPFKTVRNIRGDLEDIYESIESLRNDEDIVKAMAQRLAAANNGEAKD